MNAAGRQSAEARRAERRGEATLIALIEGGSTKVVAKRLGISERAVRKRLAVYCAAFGYTLVQAAYYLGRPDRQGNFGTSERRAEQVPLR